MESRMEALEEVVEMLKKVTWDQGSQLAKIKTRQEELDETKTSRSSWESRHRNKGHMRRKEPANSQILKDRR